jgi:hypothetical protein
MESWRHAGRILQGLREGRGWTVPMFVAELEAQGRAIGRRLAINRESLVRMVYDWEAGAHRPRDYYTLFILIYATQEELSARTIERGSELDRLMAALKAMGVSVDRRRFLLNAAALAAGAAGMPAVAANLDGHERLSWVLKHPRSVDLRTVAFLRQQILDLLRRNEATPAASLLPAVARQLEQATLLREHAPDGRVRQELFAVEAQSGTIPQRMSLPVSSCGPGSSMPREARSPEPSRSTRSGARSPSTCHASSPIPAFRQTGWLASPTAGACRAGASARLGRGRRGSADPGGAGGEPAIRVRYLPQGRAAHLIPGRI